LSIQTKLEGDLDEYRVEGDEIDAINELFKRLTSDRRKFLLNRRPDAIVDGQEGLWHWTCSSGRGKGVSIFFKVERDQGLVWLRVYAYGRHPGENNKKYKLYTHKSGGKEKEFSF
jgi:hypothetical protein